MPISHSSVGSEIKPYLLTKGQVLAIGRIIRACAEIEDIINLHLHRLAGIKEGLAIIMLGRLPVSARIKLAESLAMGRGSKTLEIHKACFDNDAYRDVMRCRNTVAHGWLLGLTDDNWIAFQVQETSGVEEGRVQTVVNAYKRRELFKIAGMAERLIPRLEQNLGLQALREKRRSPTLVPHLKSRTRVQRKAKRAPRRPASRA
jgi:hypothetical protein